MTKPIIMPIGIAGQIHLMAALRAEFNAPVIAVTLTQSVDRMLAALPSAAPEKIYSFPEFVSRRQPELDEMPDSRIRQMIVNYEHALKIPSLTQLGNMDRYFIKEQSYSRAIRHLVLFAEFAQHILDREDPLFVRGNLTTTFGLIWRKACLARNIPALKHQTSRLSGRFEFADETAIGHLRGWSSVYNDLKAGKNLVSDQITKQADAWLNEFYARPARPLYAQRNSRLNFDVKRLGNTLKHAVGVRFSKQYWGTVLHSKIDREFHFRESFGKDFTHGFLLTEARATMQRLSPQMDEPVDLDVPFIYFPLQFTPEISTLTYAPLYEDQAYLVREIAKQLPGGMRLYVKDHTSMMGRRDKRFYKRLEEVSNIKLVPPVVSTFDLMRSAKAVATITSTAGWEAFLMGRPVIAFGNIFFNIFENVLKTAVHEDLGAEIQAYIDNFEKDEAAIKRSVLAYFSVSYEGSTGDIGVDTTSEEISTTAATLARAYRDQLDRFLPDDLIRSRHAEAKRHP